MLREQTDDPIEKIGTCQAAHQEEGREIVTPTPGECYVLMGPVDFLLRIVARDIEAYERFFSDKLSALPGVQEMQLDHCPFGDQVDDRHARLTLVSRRSRIPR